MIRRCHAADKGAERLPFRDSVVPWKHLKNIVAVLTQTAQADFVLAAQTKKGS